MASLAGAKGIGKGMPPPGFAPPLAPKGKGKGPPPPPGVAFPGPAKGKGKAPPPPPGAALPVPAKGKGKAPPLAKGKGKGLISPSMHTVPVPDNLRAPGPQRIQVAPLRPLAGSVWEGLSPWDADGAGVLEGLSINFEGLLDQWTLVPTPAPAPAPIDRLLLDSKRMQNLEVAVRGTGLTPDLVLRGLTENFDLLSQDQAEALSEIIAPIHAEVRGLLQVIVGRVGVDALRSAEAVLWAVENIPQAHQLSRCAAARFKVTESVACACNPISELEELLGDLTTSRALRTVLQACLVSSNMLSQTGNVRLRIDMLAGLRLRKLQPNAPSILTLVAHDLQRAHDTRCRLRFLRLFAVGSFPIPSRIKPFIWQYLDDLKESPWDALMVLEKCKRRDLVDCADILRCEKATCLQICAASHHFDIAGASAQTCISQQLASLEVSAREAVSNMQDCELRLPLVAAALLDFFGHETPGAQVESASELLRHLALLGDCLVQEKAAIDRQLRRQHSSHYAWQRGKKWGTWTTVPTDEIILSRTTDPDVIRLLRAPCQGLTDSNDLLDWIVLGDDPSGGVSRNSRRGGADANTTIKGLDKHAHLLHGGPDGEYKRCELTGMWVPVGATATLAERDRGTRGATAGFFVTY